MSNIEVQQIRQFVDGYRNKKAKALANEAVKTFLDNYTIWKGIVGRLVDGEDGERLYGEALTTFSAILYYSSHLKKETVELLRNEIVEYEGKVRFMYEFKSALYLVNLKK